MTEEDFGEANFVDRFKQDWRKTPIITKTFFQVTFTANSPAVDRNLKSFPPQGTGARSFALHAAPFSMHPFTPSTLRTPVFHRFLIKNLPTCRTHGPDIRSPQLVSIAAVSAILISRAVACDCFPQNQLN